MLHSIKQLYGKKLEASDGEIGHVRDFYFDDQKWMVRYVVADTGSWLSGRLVLLSPHAFGSLQEGSEMLHVDLTRQQIEDSPPIDSDKPVSRQYEEDYYRYYGWEPYWAEGDLWGASAFPKATPPPLLASTPEQRGARPNSKDDPHLRSTQALSDYHIQASDGTIGHVADFIIDDGNWTIRRIIVETGHLFFGKDIALPPEEIDGISYAESKVFVKITKEAIREKPEYHLPLS